MEWQITQYTFAASAACVLVVGLGVLGWRRRPVPGAAEFVWFSAPVLWLLCMAACTGAGRRPRWQLAGLAVIPLVTRGND